jgi:hemerythrin-like domain-containing protein
LFRQHIADEEAQVLRFLVEVYGVKGAESAIVVFRQHRPIYQLIREVEKLASLPPERLAVNEMKLRALLMEHTQAEETRIFPNALSTFSAKSRGPSL